MEESRAAVYQCGCHSFGVIKNIETLKVKLSAMIKHRVVTFTFQVSLRCPGLPRLHKDCESDHISDHDG